MASLLRPLVLAVAIALPMLLPAVATADVGAGGFGISDEFHVPSISMDESFDELTPGTFRLMAIWDRLGDPAYVAQFQDRMGARAAEILLARLKGNTASIGTTEEMPFSLIERGST